MALTASVALAALAEPLGAGPGIVKDVVKRVRKVVEVGDGRVSGLPLGADAAPLLTALIGAGPGRSA
ncbi:hypothetical protein [Streptomyces sp. NPDC048496]|uniref:hypothetical protein n=1 Tax=Streptomyces sp. NPDC048496 TaxID=3365558 RepID=UPI0037124CBA